MQTLSAHVRFIHGCVVGTRVGTTDDVRSEVDVTKELDALMLLEEIGATIEVVLDEL